MTAYAAAHAAAPLDTSSTSALAERGLAWRLVSTTDDAFSQLVHAIGRGFLDQAPDEERLKAIRERSGDRRSVAVYDEQGVDPVTPVGTFVSWDSEVSLPGERAIPSCAISAVTVAPTHRRKGILRAVMSGELRAAAAVGYPVAMLTVTESTIYERFGFSAATQAASWKINTRRVHWRGPATLGRLDFIDAATTVQVGKALHERVRIATPGEVPITDGAWDSFAGNRPDAEDRRKRRAVQYRDPDGTVQGLVIYQLRESGEDDFTAHTAVVEYLLAATDDAYAALWKFMLELDLVTEVTADLRAVDEPLRWMIGDQRAAEVVVEEHEYVRVLDVVTAFESRTYRRSGNVLLSITDDLGFAEGHWLIEVREDGTATVASVTADAPEGTLVMSLDVSLLGGLLLGGSSVATLKAAGRVQTETPEDIDDIFRSAVTPRLSFWY